MQANEFKDVGLILEEGADVHGDYISVVNTANVASDDQFSGGYVVPVANGAARAAQSQYAAGDAEPEFDSVAGYVVPGRDGNTVHNPVYQEEQVLGFGDF